jgi:hypothetical protein
VPLVPADGMNGLRSIRGPRRHHARVPPELPLDVGAHPRAGEAHRLGNARPWRQPRQALDGLEHRHAQDPAGSLKPAKDKSTERIDGIVALITAIGRAMLPGEQPGLSVYEDRGILIL